MRSIRRLLAHVMFRHSRATEAEGIETDEEVTQTARERERDERLVQVLNAIVRARRARSTQ